jgi:membrane protein DedA with SNARE-associated domain
MKLPCFKQIGILYVPQNLIGWIIMSAGIVYAVFSFVDIDSRSHSASDTLRPFFINLLIIFAVYTLIAFIINSILKTKKDQPD